MARAYLWATSTRKGFWLRSRSLREMRDSGTALIPSKRIQSKPARAGLVPTQSFTLAFEGTIPRTESRTGKFSEGTSEEEWIMLDYNADYCSLGVEAGDMVHIVRFVPEAVDLAECAQFDLTGIVAPPGQYLDPIRYKILEVGPKKLRLSQR